MVSRNLLIETLLAAALLAGCGGGSSDPQPSQPASQPSSQPSTQQTTQTTTQQSTGAPASTAANVAPVLVSSAAGNVLNSPLVSVTVCVPGGNNCATIPNVIVDTGSVGLRLFKSALPASLTLPAQTNAATGHPLAECQSFGGGPFFGPVVLADIKMAGESASAVPIQLGDTSFATVPTSCSNQGTLQTAASTGANGILGVASDLQDCGAGCATTGQQGNEWYFDCSGSSCTASSLAVPIAKQVANPVSRFSSDNNGVVLSFPGLANGMASQVNGTLTFGIGTQSNNSTSGVTMVQGISNGMSTTYNGQSMTAILDSGSSVDFISSAPITTCTVQGLQWYCPGGTTTQSAVFTGGGAQLPLTFSVSDATVLNLPAANDAWAFSNLAQVADLFGQKYLDLGMSYLYGQTLYIQYPMYNVPNAMIGVQPNTATVN